MPSSRDRASGNCVVEAAATRWLASHFAASARVISSRLCDNFSQVAKRKLFLPLDIDRDRSNPG